ncbi:MAG: tRNA (adenosine(37)-N6)-threonylcarbamoyltransferase complex ATPase subunit type 1 TsaE [Candidatus Omnitrophota bacterium]
MASGISDAQKIVTFVSCVQDPAACCGDKDAGNEVRKKNFKDTPRLAAVSFISNSEKETLGLAVKIAVNLKKNDCLALVGNFGSGKTVFVKGLARGLGTLKKTYVCSPSFVILKTYPGRLPIYHFDLYRLNHARDLENIGLFEFMSAGGVSVIEWADKIKQLLLPKGCLRVEFFVLGSSMRSIKFCARAADLRRFLKRVRL